MDFCTITLPSECGMHPRQALPVSMSTVLFYLSHLSQEGEVREGSLNPYLAAVNQMHQDAGFRRPALGDYVDLLRKGFSNVEAQVRDLIRSYPHATSTCRSSTTSIARVI